MLFLSNSNHTEWNLFGSALVVIMALSPLNSYAKEGSQNSSGMGQISATTAVANPDQTLSLKGKSLSVLELLEKANKKSPQDPVIAAKLATAYIQMARDQSDASYYVQANKVIEPWAFIGTIPGFQPKEIPVQLRVVRATLSQHDHHYRQANDDLLTVIKQQPRNTQAWLTLSTIQLVQGDYQQAQGSCSALSRLGQNWLASLCYSQLFALTGQAERAYPMQQNLLAQLQDQQIELRQWVSGLMAETAMRLGNLEQAEQHFRAGLKANPNDTYILRNYSNFLLSLNRPEEVIELLQERKDDDQLLLRLAIAVKNKGDTSMQKALVEMLNQRFADALKHHNHTHGRDEALFLLEFKNKEATSKERALKLATTNWQTQKEPDDALILLRAAKLAKEPEAARTVIAWVRKYKLEDVRLLRLIEQLGT